MTKEDVSTLIVDKETHQLIKQYCFIHGIEMRTFVHEITHEKLDSFKERLHEFRKLRV